MAGTLTRIAEGVVEWKISRKAVRLGYQSPHFFFAGGNWFLCIRHMPPERAGFIHLCLVRDTGGPPTLLDVAYSISVQDVNGDRHGGEIKRKKFRRMEESPTVPMLLRENRMSDLDTLTVLCRLEHKDPTPGADAAQFQKELDEKTREIIELKRQNEELTRKVVDIEASREKLQTLLTEIEASTSGSSLPKTRLHRDLKQMFLNREDCDVVIRVKESEFRAHSNILKARSPVLASALRSDMKEKATGIVDIDDLDPSAFSDFLNYLYCEEVDSLSVENVFGLYTAADKYDVQDLRSVCVEFMRENLCVDTFCDIIRLALLHSESQLIEICTNFFIENATAIIKTIQWQTFNAENPTQGNELFLKFATSVERSKQ